MNRLDEVAVHGCQDLEVLRPEEKPRVRRCALVPNRPVDEARDLPFGCRNRNRQSLVAQVQRLPVGNGRAQKVVIVNAGEIEIPVLRGVLLHLVEPDAGYVPGPREDGLRRRTVDARGQLRETIAQSRPPVDGRHDVVPAHRDVRGERDHVRLFGSEGEDFPDTQSAGILVFECQAARGGIGLQ